MDEFHAKVRPFFQRIRPTGFQDAQITQQDLEWEKSLLEDDKKRKGRKES